MYMSNDYTSYKDYQCWMCNFHDKIGRIRKDVSFCVSGIDILNINAWN